MTPSSAGPRASGSSRRRGVERLVGRWLIRTASAPGPRARSAASGAPTRRPRAHGRQRSGTSTRSSSASAISAVSSSSSRAPRRRAHQRAGVRLLMAAGRVRIRHQDRRHAAHRELGDRGGSRARHHQIGRGVGQLHALEERQGADQERGARRHRLRDGLVMRPTGQHQELQVAPVRRSSRAAPAAPGSGATHPGCRRTGPRSSGPRSEAELLPRLLRERISGAGTVRITSRTGLPVDLDPRAAAGSNGATPRTTSPPQPRRARAGGSRGRATAFCSCSTTGSAPRGAAPQRPARSRTPPIPTTTSAARTIGRERPSGPQDGDRRSSADSDSDRTNGREGTVVEGESGRGDAAQPPGPGPCRGNARRALARAGRIRQGERREHVTGRPARRDQDARAAHARRLASGAPGRDPPARRVGRGPGCPPRPARRRARSHRTRRTGAGTPVIGSTPVTAPRLSSAWSRATPRCRRPGAAEAVAGADRDADARVDNTPNGEQHATPRAAPTPRR